MKNAILLSAALILLGSSSAFASAASAAANLGYSAAPPMPYGDGSSQQFRNPHGRQPPVRIYKPAPRQAPQRHR